MSHDYDEEVGRGTERRSRRDPKRAGGERGRQASGGRASASRQREPGNEASRQQDLGEETGSRREPGENSDARQLNVIGQGSGRGRERQNSGEGLGRRRIRSEAEISRRKKRRRIIAMIVAECFALVFIFGYGFMLRMASKIQRPNDDVIAQIGTNADINVESVERMTGYWTIAIFGVDARDSSIQKSTNADVNMICNINLETGEIRLVSVYRDSYLNISQNGSYNKINQAYFLGGAGQAVDALNRNLDLNITDWVTFNWKAVAEGINVLGGVDLELSKAEFYYINSFITETVKATGIGSKQLTHAGMNHLDGVQAVAYGRLRLMDTDYARTERQRKVIQLAFEKAQKADFQTLYTLIGTVFPNVYTSLWVDDLVNNAKNIDKFHLTETTGFPQARGEANMVKKGAVVVPATLESNVVLLHQFLFGDDNYAPSDTVKKISAKISNDTGIYKEGQVINEVGTGGGVIQTKKATSGAKKTTEADSQETEEKSTEAKGSASSEEGTDSSQKPLETSSGGQRPGETESHSGTAPSVSDRPGSSTEARESSEGRPGVNTETTASRPGGSESTSAAEGTSASHSSEASRPTEGSGSSHSSAAPTAASGTTSGAIAQFPGAVSGQTEEPAASSGSHGPGGAAQAEPEPGAAGPVAGPGQ